MCFSNTFGGFRQAVLRAVKPSHTGSVRHAAGRVCGVLGGLLDHQEPTERLKTSAIKTNVFDKTLLSLFHSFKQQAILNLYLQKAETRRTQRE